MSTPSRPLARSWARRSAAVRRKQAAQDLLLIALRLIGWLATSALATLGIDGPSMAFPHAPVSAPITEIADPLGMKTRVRNAMISVKQPKLLSQGSCSGGTPTIS